MPADQENIGTYEKALIGFIVMEPDPKMADVRDILKDESSFADPQARAAYKVLCAMQDNDAIPSDITLIVETMFKYGKSPEHRLMATSVDDLTRTIIGWTHIDVKGGFRPSQYLEYAKRIKWAADKRSIRQTISTYNGRLDDVPFDEREKFVSELESSLGNIALGVQENEGLQHISSAFDDAMKDIDLLHSGENVDTGLHVGIPSLDRITGGFKPGEVIVLAGLTGGGKTSAATAIAENVAIFQHKPVMIFSLEMMPQQLGSRIAARVAHVDYESFISDMTKLNSGFFRDTYGMAKEAEIRKKLDMQYRRMKEVQKHMTPKEVPLFYSTQSSMNPNSIKTAIIRKQRELEKLNLGNLALVQIDYLQLVESVGTGATDSASRSEQVAMTSRKIKQIAKELQVPILLLAQLNRASEQDGEPELRHLRESGAIEQDADKVMFIWCKARKNTRDDYAKDYPTPEQQRHALLKDRMKSIIKVAKNRQGSVDSCDVIFDNFYQNFISQSDEYAIGKQESFETFFEKYYMKTRSGDDLFWPLTDSELPSYLHKYRSTDGYVEKEYMLSDGTIIQNKSDSPKAELLIQQRAQQQMAPQQPTMTPQQAVAMAVGTHQDDRPPFATQQQPAYQVQPPIPTPTTTLPIEEPPQDIVDDVPTDYSDDIPTDGNGDGASGAADDEPITLDELAFLDDLANGLK